jgi:hypothetical protein
MIASFLAFLIGGCCAGLIWFGTLHLGILALLRRQMLKAALLQIMRIAMLLLLVPVAHHSASALLATLIGIFVARQIWLLRMRVAP